MNSIWIGIVILAICAINSFAQHTPGRVGGSSNNAQADRVSQGPKNAAPTALTPLTAGELQDFQSAKNASPGLTESDFRELQRYSRELHQLGKEVSVVELASTLRKRGGDIVRTLKDSGISGKQAKSLVAAHRK